MGDALKSRGRHVAITRNVKVRIRLIGWKGSSTRVGRDIPRFAVNLGKIVIWSNYRSRYERPSKFSFVQRRKFLLICLRFVSSEKDLNERSYLNSGDENRFPIIQKSCDVSRREESGALSSLGALNTLKLHNRWSIKVALTPEVTFSDALKSIRHASRDFPSFHPSLSSQCRRKTYTADCQNSNVSTRKSFYAWFFYPTCGSKLFLKISRHRFRVE